MSFVAKPLAAKTPVLTSQSRPLFLLAGCAGLLLVSVVLRVWDLGNLPGFNGDEAWTALQAVRLVHGKPIAWRTPTGNPINVFYLLPLAALHTVLTPSVALARSVAVLSGLAALGANWWFCRRVFDTPAAIISTVLLAILPIDVAYSRFGWDASQSLLATLLVLYSPLAWMQRVPAGRNWIVAAVVAYGAAVVVHPTNVFAAPLIVVPIVYTRRRWLAKKLGGWAMSARPAALAALMAVSAGLAYLAWSLLAAVGVPSELPSVFGGLYLRLFSGETTYAYLSGEAGLGWWSTACNVVILLAALAAAWGWLRRLSADELPADACLLAGWALVTLGFALVAGPRGIIPHFERYGICLIAPGCLALARGLAWWIEPSREYARAVSWALVLVAWLFPLSFVLGYFGPLQSSGAGVHRAFHTAKVEPKQAAMNVILSQRVGGETIDVVASDWWLYWPLAYLAAADPGIAVRGLESDDQPLESAQGGAAAETWYVEFAGSPREEAILAERRAEDALIRRWVVRDNAGEPLISLVKCDSREEAK